MRAVRRDLFRKITGDISRGNSEELLRFIYFTKTLRGIILFYLFHEPTPRNYFPLFVSHENYEELFSFIHFTKELQGISFLYY